MHNYKALKSASAVSVQKVEVVDQAKVDEVIGEDGRIAIDAQVKRSHEELQVVCKKYDPDTGEAQDDKVTRYELSHLAQEIERRKSTVIKIQSEQAELEQLETDLKAL